MLVFFSVVLSIRALVQRKGRRYQSIWKTFEDHCSGIGVVAWSRGGRERSKANSRIGSRVAFVYTFSRKLVKMVKTATISLEKPKEPYLDCEHALRAQRCKQNLIILRTRSPNAKLRRRSTRVDSSVFCCLLLHEYSLS